EQSKLDFAVIEGVFDKSKYGYRLYKKEAFVGICARTHPFANKEVTLEEAFRERIVVREAFSGTRMLLQNAITDRGFSLDNFKQCTSINNFSVICDVVAHNNAITFAYEPISRCRNDLATFKIKNLQISGEFNFVYCNERIAGEKIDMIFGG
ncbi:MAG: LysR family transcriptional regulator, partial [Lachnospiraceae bacterium]|nr:LysR family transcriptional regulator [Lachnospiraceae bacterium]